MKFKVESFDVIMLVLVIWLVLTDQLLRAIAALLCIVIAELIRIRAILSAPPAHVDPQA